MKQFLNFIFIGTLWAMNGFAAENSQARIQQTVKKLDAYSVTFNASEKSPKRVDALLTSYEELLERPFNKDEKKFLSAELQNMDLMPRFEMNGKKVNVYAMGPKGKDVLLKVEVVDPAKGLFKYNGKTFDLKSKDGFVNNLQMILQGLDKENPSS